MRLTAPNWNTCPDGCQPRSWSGSVPTHNKETVMDLTRITLENLVGGGLEERFSDALDKTIENILDPNTEAKAKRKLVITVTIAPEESRGHAAVAVECETKLVAPKALLTRAYLGMDRRSGQLMACEDNPEQLQLELPEKQRPVAECIRPEIARQGE